MLHQPRLAKRRNEMEQSHMSADQHDIAVTTPSTAKRPWQAPTLEKLDLFGTGSGPAPGSDADLAS
jgi:hypothetical protein